MAKIKSPFPKEVYARNAGIYKMLANPIRLEILNAIKLRAATVNELSEMLGIRKANTSQHLGVLRHLRLVNSKRQGQYIFYKIADPKIVAPCKVMKELWQK